MRVIFACARASALAAAFAVSTVAQPADPHAGHKMPGDSQMQHTNHNMQMGEADSYLMNMASGTGVNPASWPMPMLMLRARSWNVMLMGQAFLIDTQQSGPRGADKFYAPNWFMVSASHSLGRGSIMLQSMFSLDPATVTQRRYPLLFQTGETAFGKPIVDGQHPHDLFMGLGVHYARPLGEGSILQLYYAPVGDPALGPVAFPHRASAFELPQATLAHHLQDSTHIAANVATVAVKHGWWRLEASGFHGTEPNEGRWNIHWGAMNSYAGRVSVFPSKNWMAQVSAGRIAQPEAHAPDDIVRSTASLHYTRPMGNGNSWSTSLIWGRNHNTWSKRDLNSYALESLYPVAGKNFLTARVELVDKDELFANDHELEHELEHTAGSAFRIRAYTAGYTRDIGRYKSVVAGIGTNVTAYSIPSVIQPYYGKHPLGMNVFLRFRLKP